MPPTERLASGLPAGGNRLSRACPSREPKGSSGEQRDQRESPGEGGSEAGRPLWLAWSSRLRLLLQQICLFCVLLPPFSPLSLFCFPLSPLPSVTVADPSHPHDPRHAFACFFPSLSAILFPPPPPPLLLSTLPCFPAHRQPQLRDKNSGGSGQARPGAR